MEKGKLNLRQKEFAKRKLIYRSWYRDEMGQLSFYRGKDDHVKGDY
ncbi:MAG: hypothetical protein LRY73_16115 [Bacillus sp. (in: Bacteria)]|nr:hypothetical protein [Bacillus sp. (in: firmicutes)]